ncbi:MAG TPA: hypothetical protein VGN86_08195 [Pyrinomonadaceae bacterium]|nr:hypothetical protein [Pyrinomonadaceae bacterium]
MARRKDGNGIDEEDRLFARLTGDREYLKPSSLWHSMQGCGGESY